MPKEIEVLKIPPKLEEQMQYVEAIKHLAAQKKAELEAIQGKITQYKTQVATLEQRLITLENEHKSKLYAERQKFEQEKQQKLNDINNRIDILQRNEADYVRRKTEIEDKEFKNERINEERKALMNDRLRYEKLNNEAKIKLDEATKFYDETLKIKDEVARKEVIVEQKLSEAKNLFSIVENKENEFKERELDIKKQSENLIALRNEINPQIEELKALIVKNEMTLSEIRAKEQEIKDRLDEDNKLLTAIEERGRKVTAKELENATKEEELLRRELVIKNL